MPMQSEFSVVITDEEKAAAVERGYRELREWRRRNPDAPRGWAERDARLDEVTA